MTARPVGAPRTACYYPAPMKPWHLRHARTIVYAAGLVTAIAVAAVSWSDAPAARDALVSARELFGLWSLATLLVTLSAGPLTAVLPWLPLRVHLLYARRATGLTAFAFAALHVLCYAAPNLRDNWRLLFRPGPLWTAGLAVGFLCFLNMAALAWTSRDAAVRHLGGRRWKRLHRTTYVLLPLLFIHALLNGADFGLFRAPDVTAQPDAGALVGFLCFAAAWLALFVLRRKRVRLSLRAQSVAPSP